MPVQISESEGLVAKIGVGEMGATDSNTVEWQH
jgi:hypothetical protein